MAREQVSPIRHAPLTTAQRDALPAGKRPPGTMIYNLTTGAAQINTGSDAVPVWTNVNAPTTPVPFVTLAQFNALTPVDSMEVYLQADAANLLNWHLRYSVSSGKWEFLGGSRLYAFATAATAIATTGVYTECPSGARVVLPRPGLYNTQVQAVVRNDTAAANTITIIGWDVDGASIVGSYAQETTAVGYWATLLALGRWVNPASGRRLGVGAQISAASWLGQTYDVETWPIYIS